MRKTNKPKRPPIVRRRHTAEEQRKARPVQLLRIWKGATRQSSDGG